MLLVRKNRHNINENNSNAAVFCAKLASFGQLSIISNTVIKSHDNKKSVRQTAWEDFNPFTVDSTSSFLLITKTRLFKYTENFTTKKWNFSDKNSDIFHISAQNIDCGYSLEPPRRGGSNEYPQSMFLSRKKKIMYIPVNPSFTI